MEVKEGQTIIKSFTYNPANQISSADFSYDDNGNMTGDTDKRYVYDAENRLQQVVSKATSQTIASYEYDFMGRRTSSTDTSGSTTYFHYDGWNVVAESNTSGTITANYYYDTSGQVQAMKKAGQTYYYQFNAHGDVVSLTDSSGSVVNSYTYDPWGSHLTSSETVKSPFRYAGYRFDEDTGLYYLRARYYGPEIGRFLTRDSWAGDVSLPLSLNPYIYVGENPVVYIDPLGLWQIEADAYLKYGGGIALGKNHNTIWYRGWFLRLRVGAGIGGGIGFDPISSSPKYNKKGGVQATSGVFADADVNFGPSEIGMSGGTGTYADAGRSFENLTSSYKYFSPLDATLVLERQKVGAGAAAGFEGYLTW